MPQGPKHSPLIKPFVVLALPGMYLFYKYNQYKRKRKENATRRLAERELQHLNNKIEKLLSKLEESEPEPATCQEEECVICIHAKATMQTAPCGHQVVCRKCFVKTIQIAVSQRLLPLRCVICRAKILRLKTGPILPSSASGYSMTSHSTSVPQSDSLYSVSSGESSVSSTSCSSSGSKGSSCCGGHCLGAYPRQPSTSAIRRSQQHAMKVRLQEYCRPERNHVNRLPPIKELPGQSPLHAAPPASTRIRCAQKIVTQLELPLIRSKGYKYEKLPQNDEDEEEEEDEEISLESSSSWWLDSKRDRTKIEERIDNRKNEMVEKQMEMKAKKVQMKERGVKDERFSRRDQDFQARLPTQDEDHRHHFQRDFFSQTSSMRGNQPKVLVEVLRTIQKLSERNGSQPSTILSHILVAKRLHLKKPTQQIKQALTSGLKAGLIKDVGKGKVKLGMSPKEYNAFKKFIDVENKMKMKARSKMQKRKKCVEPLRRKKEEAKFDEKEEQKGRFSEETRQNRKRPKTKPRSKNVVAPNIKNSISTASNANIS